MKMNLEDVRQLASNQRTFASGVELSNTHDINLLRTVNPHEYAAYIECDDAEHQVRVTLDEDEKRLLNSLCTCASSRVWRGSCIHVCALLIELIRKNSAPINYTISSSNQKRTSSEALAILNKLKDDTHRAIKEEVKQVSEMYEVSPEFEISSNGIQIKLSVGLVGGRKYVVKDIPSFIKSVEFKQNVSYGKKFEFVHDIREFTAFSKKLIDFLTGLCKAYYSNSYSQYRAVPINNAFLDEFFETVKGYSFPVQYIFYAMANETKLLLPYVTFEEFSPIYKLSVTHQNEGYRLTCNKKPLLLINGVKYAYVIGDGKMIQVNKDYMETARFFWIAKNEIFFGKDKISEFVNYIYPRLKELELLDENSEIEIEDGESLTKFYIDKDSDGVVVQMEVTGSNVSLDEYRNALRLEAFGFVKEKNRYRLYDDDKIYDFYLQGPEALRQFGEVFVTDTFDNGFVPKESPVKMGLRYSGNLLELKLDLSSYSPSELLDIVESIKVKKRYHKLKNGNLVSLDNESLKDISDIITGLDLTKKELKDVIKLPAYRAMYLDKLTQDNENVEKDKGFKRFVGDFKNFKDFEETPSEMANILREYQRVGYSWLKLMTHYGFGGILADDMGLGKTIQVIALIQSDLKNVKKQSMVVAPTSLIYNWRAEFERFAPEIKTTVLSGTPNVRKELFAQAKDTDVFITTYDTLKRDIDNYEETSFRFVIADEAQFIKNPVTQNATAVKALKSDVRFALTGTPMENSLMELWSIFDFVIPGYLFSATKFTKLYESPIIKNNDEAVKKNLKNQITPFILRRIKSQVLTELPEKTERTLFAEMTGEQRKLYSAYLLKAKNDLEELINDGFNKNQIKILSHLTRMRQLCCHPGMFVENYNQGSGKLELLLETINIALESGSRILLFSQFTSMLGIIMDELNNTKYKYFYLDGGTDAKDRLRMTEAFNKGERDLFLISLKAGGTGLNLTGADVVIHYDPWWNPAVMGQATDRAHRYGQKKAVQVFNLVTKDSIEEKIIELQNKKRDLIDSVVSEGATFLNKLSEDEIRGLFV